MGFRTFWRASLIAGVCWAPVSAQQLPTTVQLPTFSFFTVNTTVVVPDRGRMQLGRHQRAARARQFFGPGFPRGAGARGAQRSVIDASVTAHVHDLNELDGQLKGSPQSTLRINGVTLGAQFERTRASSASGTVASLAEIRGRQAAADAAGQRAAERYVERAKTAESAGKNGAARIYYQMALRRASGSLAAEILRSIAEFDAEKGHSVTARRPVH